MASMIDAALDYASRGWPVFPAKADKSPYTENGYIDATTDEAQIREWWNRWPTANIAMSPGAISMMVVDLDPGADEDALDEAIGGLHETGLEAKTPRDGSHLYYEIAPDEVIASSAGRLSDHVDVRSSGGYVLLPPSTTKDGEYSWRYHGKPSYRTDELKRVACSAREKDAKRQEWTIEPDLPENVEYATRWLAGNPVPECGLKTGAKIAVSGQGGDHTAYATAAMMISFGLSREKASELIWDVWNPQCSPPWSADDADHLEQKITNAWDEYHTSQPGNVTPSFKRAAKLALFQPIDRVDIPSGNEWTAGPFRFVDREGMEHIRDPEWLVEGLLPRGSYGILYGSSSAGKTFLALDLALSIAAGSGFSKNALWNKKVLVPGSVLFAVGEGRDQLKIRVKAWEAEHFGGAKVEDFILADPVPHVNHAHQTIPDTEKSVLDVFLDGAEKLDSDFSLVVIDTVGRSMQGVNENAQEHASAFTLMVETIQKRLDCAVLALHHTGHGKGAEGKRERGSSVFGADADVRLHLERPGEGEIATLDMVKQKDAPTWKTPLVFKMAERPVDEDNKSLVVSKATVEDAPLIKRTVASTKKAQEKKAEEDDAATLDIVEEVALAEMKKNPAKTWSSRALAIAVACHPKINVKHEALRKHLARLREQNDRPGSRCYNVGSGEWRHWTPPKDD